MKAFVIKHTLTNDNKKGIIQGHSDSPLVKEGNKQAKQLGKFLKDKGIKHIFSSDLGRCVQTTKIVNSYLNTGVDYTVALREQNFGKYNATHSSKVDLIIKDDPNTIPEGGESHNQVKERVIKYLLNLKTEYDPILIVTHGGGFRSILSEVLKLPIYDSRCDTGNDTIIKISIEKELKLIEMYYIR